MAEPVTWFWDKLAFTGLRFVDVGQQKGTPTATVTPEAWVYWVTDDGQLYRCDQVADNFTQVNVPAFGKVIRVAVSPDSTVWCVTDDRKAYYLLLGDVNGNWQQLDLHANFHPADVDVAVDESTWFTGASHNYAVRTAAGELFYPTWALGLQGLSGIRAASGDVAGQLGGAWGISESMTADGSGAVIFCNDQWAQYPPGGKGKYIDEVVDFATTPNLLYLVKEDGSVWTTIDGTTQKALPAILPTPMIRVSVGYTAKFSGDPTFAVAADGTAWLYGTK